MARLVVIATPLSRGRCTAARRSGDKAALAAALGAQHTAIWGQLPAERRLEVASEMARLGDDASDPEVAFQGAAWSFADLLELGRLEDADTALARVRQFAEELRQPAYRWWAHMLRATRAYMAGEFAEAESNIREGGLWGRRAHIPTAEMYEVGQLHYLRLEQGRADEVIELTRRLAPVYPAVTSIRCMLAQACAEAGREDEAREYLHSMANDEAALSMMNASWSIGMYSLAMACAQLGDAGLATQLYQALRPLEPYCHVAFRGSAFQGSAARTLGLLAAGAGQDEAAEGHLRHAIEQNESMVRSRSSRAPAASTGCCFAGAEMSRKPASSFARRGILRRGSASAIRRAAGRSQAERRSR